VRSLSSPANGDSARNIGLDDQRIGARSFFRPGAEGHILRAHMDAADQVQMLPAGK
jgi:hypothetical protein